MSSIQRAPSRAALPTHLAAPQARDSLPERPRRPARPNHCAGQRSHGRHLGAPRSPSRGTRRRGREPTPRREACREPSLALGLGRAPHTGPGPARAAMLGRSRSATGRPAREACWGLKGRGLRSEKGTGPSPCALLFTPTFPGSPERPGPRFRLSLASWGLGA